jgi:hypothetical protein
MDCSGSVHLLSFFGTTLLSSGLVGRPLCFEFLKAEMVGAQQIQVLFNCASRWLLLAAGSSVVNRCEDSSVLYVRLCCMFVKKVQRCRVVLLWCDEELCTSRIHTILPVLQTACTLVCIS